MNITIPWELGQEVYWVKENREEVVIRMQFIGFTQSINTNGLLLQFGYIGTNPYSKVYTCTLTLERALNEIFIENPIFEND